MVYLGPRDWDEKKKKKKKKRKEKGEERICKRKYMYTWKKRKKEKVKARMNRNGTDQYKIWTLIKEENIARIHHSSKIFWIRSVLFKFKSTTVKLKSVYCVCCKTSIPSIPLLIYSSVDFSYIYCNSYWVFNLPLYTNSKSIDSPNDLIKK